MPDNSSTILPIRTAECAKSKKSCDIIQDSLPPYLNNTDPLEPEDIPLQLALITMEMASYRQKLTAMAAMFAELAKLVNPDLFLPPEFD